MSKRRVRVFLERALGNLDPNTIARGLVLNYRDGPVAIDFEIVGVRAVEDTAVEAWSMMCDGSSQNTSGVLQIRTYERIRHAIDEKVSRYGNVREPYLLVLWPHEFLGPDEFEVERALFGDCLLTFRWGGQSVVETGDARALNGAFTGHLGPTPLRTRLSAVAIYSHSAPDRRTNRFELAIYHNPYAAYPLDRTLFSEFPQMAQVGGTHETIEMGWIGGQPSWCR